MKTLFFGGQKSGKSKLAEQEAIKLSKNKAYYIATYDDSYDDNQMKEKISLHKKQRGENFITIEEKKDLSKVIKDKNTYLVDCLSMWILNNFEEKRENLFKQLELLAKIDANIVFVLNDLSCGVVPLGKESRDYVDLSGIVGQKVASFCDEVYEVKLGIKRKLK